MLQNQSLVISRTLSSTATLTITTSPCVSKAKCHHKSKWAETVPHLCPCLFCLGVSRHEDQSCGNQTGTMERPCRIQNFLAYWLINTASSWPNWLQMSIIVKLGKCCWKKKSDKLKAWVKMQVSQRFWIFPSAECLRLPQCLSFPSCTFPCSNPL